MSGRVVANQRQALVSRVRWCQRRHNASSSSTSASKKEAAPDTPPKAKSAIQISTERLLESVYRPNKRTTFDNPIPPLPPTLKTSKDYDTTTSWTKQALDTSRILPPTSSKTLKPSTKEGPFVTYSGRSKTVQNGDLSGAFKSLNITLRNNAVAKEYKKQKFYEKPSDKRGRLSRERHRRRFLLGVKRLVGLVKETRKFQ